MCGRMQSFLESYILDLMKKFFENAANQKVGKLSTGYQVRFQLAFALSHDAKLFILDEPASGLDPLFRKELMRYLQEIVEDGTRSVLMSTHITEDLDRIGDYILLMKDGRIVWDLQIEEVRERYLIVYGKRRGRTVSARKSDLQVFWRIQKLCIYQKRYEYRLWKI